MIGRWRKILPHGGIESESRTRVKSTSTRHTIIQPSFLQFGAHRILANMRAVTVVFVIALAVSSAFAIDDVESQFKDFMVKHNKNHQGMSMS